MAFRPPRSPKAKRRSKRVAEIPQCRICRERKSIIDYKDVPLLQKLVTAQGKLLSRKRSGNCAGCQRKTAVALKRARFMALMPFVG